MNKRHHVWTILFLCVFAASCGSNESTGGDRVSTPGEYSGYSDAIYADEYDISSQYVEVRDGTKLAVDLYRPKDKTTGEVIEEPLPVIWMHTPYNRRYNGNNVERLTVEYYAGTAGRLVKYGYVVGTVDFRGLYASYGKNQVYNRGEWLSAAKYDAYDITEWLAEQPWSNGNIGMWGCSATGGSQMQAATAASPHLKAIFPMSCELDVFAFRVPGGMSSDGPVRPRPDGDMRPPHVIRDAAAVPVDADIDGTMLQEAIAEHQNPIESAGYTPYRDSLSPTINDPAAQQWWLDSSSHTMLEEINSSGIAMYLAGNWNEGPTKHGVFFTFNNVTNPTKLILGPGGHCAWDDVERETGFDITIEERRFFDHWLKGIDNAVMDEDPVYLYTYNAPAESAWRAAEAWPLPNETRVKYYLGEGSLGTAEPTEADQKDEKKVDYDVTLANMAEKGLVYETEPLGEDVEVTGHPTINMWVSSTATDGDFVVDIQDVSPDGEVSSYHMDGQLRASLRKLHDPPFNNLGLPWHRAFKEDESLLVPGEPVELVFPILPGSILFKAGHRIRLAVHFSDRRTKRLDPAPTVTIYRDANHRSYVTLPIIESE